MAWADLSSELGEMFEPLQGCAHVPHLLALPGMHVINKRSGSKTPEEIRIHNSRPEVKAAKRAHDRGYRVRPHVMAKKNESKRRKSLEANLQKWATDAKLILIGRGANTTAWANVMAHPVTVEEKAAQTDFIFFLRQCRKCSAAIIANMLGISKAEVKAALSSRGVKDV